MSKHLPHLITLQITAHNGAVGRIAVTQEQFALAYLTAKAKAAKVEALVTEVYL